MCKPANVPDSVQKPPTPANPVRQHYQQATANIKSKKK